MGLRRSRWRTSRARRRPSSPSTPAIRSKKYATAFARRSFGWPASGPQVTISTRHRGQHRPHGGRRSGGPIPDAVRLHPGRWRRQAAAPAGREAPRLSRRPESSRPRLLNHEGRPLPRPAAGAVFVADVLGAIFAYGAIQAALVQHARTGEGRRVDAALMDCMPISSSTSGRRPVAGRSTKLQSMQSAARCSYRRIRRLSTTSNHQLLWFPTVF